MADGAGEVHDVPMSVISRPLQSVVDEAKVQSLMETLREQEGQDKVPPVTLLWLEGSKGGNYYFGFGGCHRYTAHKRLGRETIRAIMQRTDVSTLRTLLGSACPEHFE
eukprot:TRINITY_DN7975_c2_g1_i1.p1 TRINITY_DN7975_c2_g1~~TRINITY_DN7975_c2_g1_i1.p1  ORF type:complete len:124 (+),score=37.46 TRINITY_DN7975_c2_g1_i1:50-373(+)